MQRFNGVPDITYISHRNGIKYKDFKRDLYPKYFIVWRDIILCLTMVFVPFLLISQVPSLKNGISLWFFFVSATWVGFWTHSYTLFFHEAAHFNIVKNRKLNDTISNIIFMPFTGRFIHDFRLSHWEHHKHLGTAEDTEISYLSPLSLSEFILSFLGIYQIRTILKIIKDLDRVKDPVSNKNSRSKTFLLALLLMITIQLAIALILSAITSTVAGLLWVFSFFIMYPAIARVRQTLEHRSFDAHKATNSSDHGPVNRNFGNDKFSYYFGAAGFNRHLLHHYDPTVSYTRFDELHDFFSKTEVHEDIEKKNTTYTKAFKELIKW